MRCSALTAHFVQCRRRRSAAVQVLLRSRDADLRHSISELQGLHCRGAGVSCNLCLCLCLRRLLTCHLRSSELGVLGRPAMDVAYYYTPPDSVTTARY